MDPLASEMYSALKRKYQRQKKINLFLICVILAQFVLLAGRL